MFLRPKLLGIIATALLSLGLTPPTEAAPSPSGNRVVVDAGGVYMRATSLLDGSILGAYAAQDGANHVLRAVKSTDHGASWKAVGTISQGPSATLDIDNAFPLQLPSGRLLLAFRNHDRTSSGYTYYRITLCYSDDNGASWFFLSQIDERAAQGKNGFWEPFLRLAGNGNLQAFYSAENSDADQDNIMKVSTDNGKTWSSTRPVSGQGLTSRDGMMGVANVDNNGNLICVFENTESGPFSIDYVLSQDDGFTWNSRKRLYTAANGKEAGAPHIINVGGTLVADFMTTEDGGGPGVDGGEMKVVTSSDKGKTWSASTIIGPLGSHWPGLFTLDSTHFLALYSLNGVGLVSQPYKL